MLWIPFVLAGGLGEEFLFRSFGIAVFRRIGLPTSVAASVPALAWVFIHDALPPVFVAGYFLVGLLFAALFLWRGFTFVWIVHVSLNLLVLLRP